MYYPESEKKEFERRKCANYHPKGIMPLGDCLITKMAEPDNPHMISIVNELSQVGWNFLLGRDADCCFANGSSIDH